MKSRRDVRDEANPHEASFVPTALPGFFLLFNNFLAANAAYDDV